MPLPKENAELPVKALAKDLYLNLRRYLLRAMAIFIFQDRQILRGSGREIRKILFIRIDRIGDLVLSTPALKALKKNLPRSQLVVLASPSNHSLLLHNPYVDEVLVYDQAKGLADTIRVIKELRRYGFDLAVDPYPDYELRTALIAFLSGARKRVGYASYGREVFFTVSTPKADHSQHFIDVALGVLAPLGIRVKDKAPEIFLTDDEKEWTHDWLKAKGVWGKPVVGIHPGGYYQTQRWLPERFAEVANQVKEDGYASVVMFGGPGEEGLVNRISSMIHGDVPAYCGHNLRRFAALIYSCCVLICNNSGPLHIAVALGIPTISFMGPTNQARWMPIGAIHTVFRMDDLPCIGCNLGSCKIKTHDCMRLITASMVLEAARNILQAINNKP